MTDQYYNHIELFSPIPELFPEITNGKIFQMTIITKLEEFDINPLIKAQTINNVLIKVFDKIEFKNDVKYNERYFPMLKDKSKKESINDDAFIINGEIVTQNQIHTVEDFIICDNTLSNKENDILSLISTISMQVQPITKKTIN